VFGEETQYIVFTEKFFKDASIPADRTIIVLSTMNARADDASTGVKIAKQGVSGDVSTDGVRGEGNISTDLRLAGLSAAYMSVHMVPFASGTRRSQIMRPILHVTL
jgi:cytochrome c553